MSTSSAFFAGMYLGASGDTRIIERQNRQVQKTDTIQAAWNGTGKALQVAPQVVDALTDEDRALLGLAAQAEDRVRSAKAAGTPRG